MRLFSQNSVDIFLKRAICTIHLNRCYNIRFVQNCRILLSVVLRGPGGHKEQVDIICDGRTLKSRATSKVLVNFIKCLFFS
jgi:hypothetical protein